MLRLRSRILTHLISPSSTCPVSQFRRLISAVPPNPSFAADDYLVGTCGLTPAQALKASPKLSHLRSSSKPDAVLAFLAGLGLSGADVAAVVAKDPRLLCASVERTLAPIVAGLTGHGLSRAEIASLVSLGRTIFRTSSVVSNLPYYISLLGSVESLVRFLKRSSSLFGSSLEKVIKPNVAFLRECGLGACDISRLCLYTPRLIAAGPESLRTMVACAEGLGVPRGSRMFRYALRAVALRSEETIAAKLEHLKETFRWSEAEVGIAVCKFPGVLELSKDRLQRKSEFLYSDVGLEPAYIAHRPSMLGFSLEGRIRPRYYVLKFLKEKGLLHPDRDYYNLLTVSEKVFMERFICPHKEAAPYLAQDYATACKGQVPNRFRFA